MEEDHLAHDRARRFRQTHLVGARSPHELRLTPTPKGVPRRLPPPPAVERNRRALAPIVWKSMKTSLPLAFSDRRRPSPPTHGHLRMVRRRSVPIIKPPCSATRPLGGYLCGIWARKLAIHRPAGPRIAKRRHPSINSGDTDSVEIIYLPMPRGFRRPCHRRLRPGLTEKTCARLRNTRSRRGAVGWPRWSFRPPPHSS